MNVQDSHQKTFSQTSLSSGLDPSFKCMHKRVPHWFKKKILFGFSLAFRQDEDGNISSGCILVCKLGVAPAKKQIIQEMQMVLLARWLNCEFYRRILVLK